MAKPSGCITIVPMVTGKYYLMAALSAGLLLLSCGEAHKDSTFDPTAGTVTRNQNLPLSLLEPDSIAVASEFDHYYISDKIVFLGSSDTSQQALYLHFGRGLQDNRFKRAERVFSGFLFNGQRWLALTYTRAHHLEPRLDQIGDSYFCKFNWNESHNGGEISYDRRGLKFKLEFADLVPVQGVRDGLRKRHAHGIGIGTLTHDSTAVTGLVYYESVQMEGFNPIVDHWEGVDFSNYDWLALTSDSGDQIVAACDSTAPGERLYKNFLAYAESDSIRYADGSANVRIASDQIRRDAKITDFLALKKSISIEQLDFGLSLDLTADRLFYTSGFCIAIVTGELRSSGGNREVWGILEHVQKPGSDREALR